MDPRRATNWAPPASRPPLQAPYYPHLAPTGRAATRKITGLACVALVLLGLVLAADAFDRARMLVDSCVQWQEVEATKEGCDTPTWTTQTRSSMLQEYGLMTFVVLATIVLVALSMFLRLAPLAWISFVVMIVAPLIWGTGAFALVYVPLFGVLLGLSIVLTRTPRRTTP